MTAARFAGLADAALASLARSRHRRRGTGLYVRALLRGSRGAGADAAAGALETRTRTLRERLAALDPESTPASPRRRLA